MHTQSVQFHRVSTAIRKCGTLQPHTQNISTRAKWDTGFTNAALRYWPWSESGIARTRPCRSVTHLWTFARNLMLPSSWHLNVSLLSCSAGVILYNLWDLKLGEWSVFHKVLPLSTDKAVKKSCLDGCDSVQCTANNMTPRISTVLHSDTTLNNIRTFVNEPFVSTTQYSVEAVGSTSEESRSITGGSGKFFLSVMRPDTLWGPLNVFSKGSRM